MTPRHTTAAATIELPLDALEFPDHCCVCDAQTDLQAETEAAALGAWSILLRFDVTVTIAVPLCMTCYEAARATVRRATLWGLGIGMLLGLPASIATRQILPGWMMFAMLGISVGPLLGWVLGKHLARYLPVARYLPLKKALRLGFRAPGYIQRFSARRSDQ